jgi:allantoinase
MIATHSRFALASSRVVLSGGVRPAAVVVDGERIADIVAPSSVPSSFPLEDLGDLVIAPGLVDAHVHINEPGRTEWEGFETATRAAAAGGVTTLADMPLNSSPVTTTRAGLNAKRAAASGRCSVDVGFYGGLIPGNSDHIEPLLDAGVLGIKAFLCDSGLPEFPAASIEDLKATMPLLARRNRPLLVHAELCQVSAPAPRDVRSYEQYLASRPPEWEAAAIRELIALCRWSGCPVHVVHLANADVLPMLQAARQENLPITVETGPHYLHFKADQIPAGDTRFKCAPPIRDQHHRELLWDGLQRGVIDTIGSDHSPCPPELKRLDSGDFSRAWGGIASLQLTLPIIWTNAAERGISLDQLFVWLSEAPARLLRLDQHKGRLAAGYDADLVVWDPDTRWTARGQQLEHRHKLTPYDGTELAGRVHRTYLRGSLVYDNGSFPGSPSGALLSGVD